MESLRKNMDSAIKHWGAFPRVFPSRFKVTNLAFVAGKRNWVRTTFDTCNFSLILAGRGEYRRGGRVWAVEAPAVIIQLTGEYVEYGPVEGGTWDELYIVYDAPLQAAWIESGVLDPAVPMWAIRDLAAVEAQLIELSGFLHAAQPERMADRLDRVSERLVMETRLAPVEEEVDADASAVARVAARLRLEFTGPVDFEALAARQGMSASTFRRRWQEFMPVPPARFLQALRIQEACRQLVETPRPVREIARRVGFEDELYFSRRFRLETGVPPREYRRRFRLGWR